MSMRPWIRSNGSVAKDQSPSASADVKVQFPGLDFGFGGVMSTPRTWEFGCSDAKVMAQMPVPQPMSRTCWLVGEVGSGALWRPRCWMSHMRCCRSVEWLVEYVEKSV